MKISILKFLDRSLRFLLTIMTHFKQRKIGVRSSVAPKKILVIKMSALGDAVWLMPSLRFIKAKYPNAKLSWLTTERSSPHLFSPLEFINEIMIMPTNPLLAVRYIVKNKGYFSDFDLIIDFDQYYAISELISLFGKISVGFRTSLKGASYDYSLNYAPFINERYHFYELACLAVNDTPTFQSSCFFELPELISDYHPSHCLVSLQKFIQSDNRRVVILYPGSSLNASFRRWSPTRYIQVVKELEDKFLFIVAGGPDEVELIQIFRNSLPSELIWINTLSLQDWLWFFRHNAYLFLGNDGGLMHLAESQGLPSISIFGPTLFAKAGSINARSIGIESDEACRPCIRNYEGIIPDKCMLGHLRCLDSINSEMVIEKLLAYSKSV